MIEDRELFERAFLRFAPPEDHFGRLVSRRGRKRRNQRAAAGAVAVILTVVVIGVVLRAIDRSPTPLTPTPPSATNGDIAFVGSNVVDFSDDVSDFRVLYAVDPSGGTPTKLLAADAVCPTGPDQPSCDGVGFDSVAWSPDGTRIVFVLRGFPLALSDHEGIYAMDTQTGIVQQLTSCANACVVQTDLTWTPDGSRITFTQADGSGCDRANAFEGSCSLFTMRPDGTDVVRVDTGSVVDPVSPSWSPDGTAIAFSAREGEDWFVYTMSDGSEPVRLTADLPSPEETRPSWSPDGSTIAFIAWEGAASGEEPTTLDGEMGLPYDVWLMAPDGSERRHLIAGCCLIGGAGYPAHAPVWSPDGARILLHGGTGGSLDLIDPRTGAIASIDTRRPTGAISWQPIPRP